MNLFTQPIVSETPAGRCNIGRILLALIIAAAVVQEVRGDRGAIPFKRHVAVFEPNQRALLAWNGTEQITILTTDLRVSQPTKVLEVMPFPTEPAVTNADIMVFRRAVDLINAKLRAKARHDAEEAMMSRYGGIVPPAAGQITFHERIGAHEVVVAQVLNPVGFVKWVTDYLKRSQVDNPTVPPVLQASVNQYLKEGFGWLVFDVILVENQLQTIEPLQYRFRTSWLYYPIKISQTNQGTTSIQLLVLTPGMLRTFSGIPIERVALRHEPVDLTSAEVRSIHPELDDLLGHRDEVKLRIWWIYGDFQSLNMDLLAR